MKLFPICFLFITFIVSGVNSIPHFLDNAITWVDNTFHQILTGNLDRLSDPCGHHFTTNIVPKCGMLVDNKLGYDNLCSQECCDALVFPPTFECDTEWVEITDTIVRSMKRDMTSCGEICPVRSMCTFNSQQDDTPCSDPTCQGLFVNGTIDTNCQRKIETFCRDNISYNHQTCEMYNTTQNFNITRCVHAFTNFELVEQTCFDFISVLLKVKTNTKNRLKDYCFTINKRGLEYKFDRCFQDTHPLKPTDSPAKIGIGIAFIVLQLAYLYPWSK